MIRSKMDIWTIKETIFDRCYEKEFIKFEDDWNVIDIGVAFGDFSIWYAKTYPRSRINAFEPHPDSFELANLNIQTNSITNIRLQNKAVGSNDRIENINFNFRTAPGSHSLCDNKSNQNTETQQVSFLSLKNILANISSIDLIKLDCEGGEYDILLNSSNETIQKIRFLVMEWHDGITSHNHHELVKRLKDCGFEVKVHLNPVHANIGLIFARNQHL